LNSRALILSTVLAVIFTFFHLSAGKQPSDDEASMSDSMSRPLARQGRPAPDLTVESLNSGKFTLSARAGEKAGGGG
jgi:hypothetical protein